MSQRNGRQPVSRLALGVVVVVLGTLAPGCGNDVPTFIYDCCTRDSNLFYVCPTRLAYSQCLSNPPDTSGCALQTNPCPPTANQ